MRPSVKSTNLLSFFYTNSCHFSHCAVPYSAIHHISLRICEIHIKYLGNVLKPEFSVQKRKIVNSHLQNYNCKLVLWQFQIRLIWLQSLNYSCKPILLRLYQSWKSCCSQCYCYWLIPSSEIINFIYSFDCGAYP